MATTLTLIVPAATPSTNTWAGRPRYVYAEMRRRWKQLLFDAWLEQRARDVALFWEPGPGRIRLEVARHTPKRDALDWDNAQGGLKPVIDAMRQLGLIADDTARLLTPSITQPVSRPGDPAKYWTSFTLTREEA